MAEQILRWLSSGVSVGAVGAAIAFVVSVFQFLSVRRREVRDREYEKYHALIMRLVRPEPEVGLLIAVQVAAIFELRHFPRYFECTERILADLYGYWNDPKFGKQHEWRHLIAEIGLTRAFIRSRLHKAA
jgi:hypothetical protein